MAGPTVRTAIAASPVRRPGRRGTPGRGV